MECKKNQNLKNCNCTYNPCSRKGVCCDCIKYHLSMEQLPGCCFPDEAEKSWDRSFRNFIKIYSKKYGI